MPIMVGKAEREAGGELPGLFAGLVGIQKPKHCRCHQEVNHELASYCSSNANAWF